MVLTKTRALEALEVVLGDSEEHGELINWVNDHCEGPGILFKNFPDKAGERTIMGAIKKKAAAPPQQGIQAPDRIVDIRAYHGPPGAREHQMTVAGDATLETVHSTYCKMSDFFRDVKYQLYEAAHYHKLQKSKKKALRAAQKALTNMELNEERWAALLSRLPGGAAVSLVALPVGLPFSSYCEGLGSSEFSDLVRKHLGVKTSDGHPTLDEAHFKPGPDFINQDTVVEWGSALARQQTSFGRMTDMVSCVLLFLSYAKASLPSTAVAEVVHRAYIDIILSCSLLIANHKHQQRIAGPPSAQVPLQPAQASVPAPQEAQQPADASVPPQVRQQPPEPQQARQPVPPSQPYFQGEYPVNGEWAWGKIDYVLIYRTLAVIMVEAKKGSLEQAFGQLVMEMASVRAVLARRYQEEKARAEGASSLGKKRTHAEAFALDPLTTYALLCTATDYLVVAYQPPSEDRPAKWLRSATMKLGINESSTPEDLAATLKQVLSTLAYALAEQMQNVDEAITKLPHLVNISAEALTGVMAVDENDDSEAASDQE